MFYQKTGQRNQQFCDSSFEGFLLFGVEYWGVCGALAAEAIWVSSTSKVGQLVPVPLLMCWRGALCGGLRARLKGLRSLLGWGGVNMASRGGGQDLGAMWKLYHVHWPLSACTGPAAIAAGHCNKQRGRGCFYCFLQRQCQHLRRKACQVWGLSTNSSKVGIGSTILAFAEVFNEGLISGPVNEAPPWPQLHKSGLENMTGHLGFLWTFCLILLLIAIF